MEDIIAAIPVNDSPKNVSSQEFQDMLTSWFEKKGILCELRTNLRYKMINVIKNTSIGRDIVQKSHPSSISLSKQAISLIVAEFLMKNNCDYSLSLFNTESGLSPTFPDNINNKENKSLQFDQENILNILELIGVHKMSDMCDEILKIYYKNNENNSILSAIISVLSKCVLENCDQKAGSDVDLSNETDFIRNVGTVLFKLNIPYSSVALAIENIKSLYKNEMYKIEENCNKTILKLKNNAILKEKQLNEIKKKNNILELKIMELIKNHNDLKIKVKHAMKERNAKEKELFKFKHKENKQFSEQKGLKPECGIEQYGVQSQDNSKLITELQGKNEELVKENNQNAGEINAWKTKYQSLLQEFTSFHQKICSLSLNGNTEIPASFFNLSLLDEELKCSNTNNPFESTDSSTEEIIRDSRMRLKVLEEESEEIEGLYKNVHNKNKCKLL